MVNTLKPPMEVILSWPKPNYINPDTRGDGLYIVSLLLASLGILMVGARLYSRFFITKAPGFDDALIVLALLFGIALSVLVIIGNKTWYSGHHIWDIPPDKYVGHRLNVWIAQFVYVAALSCVKISVLLFYRRLSVTFSKTFMIATWIGIIYNLLYLIGFSFALLFACYPIKAYWWKVDREWAATHDFRCGSEQIGLPTAGALSVLGDFYSALLPMLLIMHLELPRRQKLSLYGLFAIAFLVVGAGIARTVLLNTVINKDYDFTWVLWEMWIWGEVELYVALLAASAPALKPFLRRFFIEPMTSVVDSGRKRGGSYGDHYGDRVEMKNGHARKDFEADPERIGIAYGGPEITKSREEIFVRDVDDGELETRHYELRQSRDGKKMVPMQIWKKARNSASTRETNNWPVPPIDATHQQYKQHQNTGQGHMRNFSQPHSYKSSGDTTTGLLPPPNQRGNIVSQVSPTDSLSSDPHVLGRDHVMRRLSQGSGSVKFARLRAQQQMFNSRDASIASPPPQSNLRSNSTAPPQYQSQEQYMSHQRTQRDHLRPGAVSKESEGRGSRLEDPSDDSSEDGNYASDNYEKQRQQDRYQPPFYQARGEMKNQMYVVEKPPRDNRQSARAERHNRSSSEETLALPRMGSTDDFSTVRREHQERERRRAREAELNDERARIAMRETEREIEREREWDRQDRMRMEIERRRKLGR